MAVTGLRMPQAKYPGAIPTLNGRGFMLESLDPYSKAFVEFAPDAEAPMLDVGCAYGVATLAALANGAQMVACDMDAGHVAILKDHVPIEHSSRLTTSVGVLPDIDFPSRKFGAILASRVLHFLTGDDVEQAVKKMATWLIPGGRLYLVADSPYMPNWNAAASDYESLKQAGHKWPGFLPDFSKFVPEGTDPNSHPDFLNPMDPDILARVCEEAGLNVVSKSFMGLQRGGPATEGKEHAGCEAVKASD